MSASSADGASEVARHAAQIAARAAELGPGRRIIALIGPPGSGKSTLADALAEALQATGHRAAVLPMDGFHYDDAVLTARGLLARKGAPETFDVAGFAHLLDRLRANQESEIAAPVFDRTLEVSRNAARLIPADVDCLIVEGNYLLLDEDGWRDLANRFDLTVALDVEDAELRRRLEARWRGQGLDEATVRAKVDGNDLPNARLVRERSRPAGLVLGG